MTELERTVGGAGMVFIINRRKRNTAGIGVGNHNITSMRMAQLSLTHSCSMKKAKVGLLSNPNIPSEDPKLYRPICLFYKMVKMIVNVICSRLVPAVEAITYRTSVWVSALPLYCKCIK